MYKIYDYVTGEILEMKDFKIFGEEKKTRIEEYKSKNIDFTLEYKDNKTLIIKMKWSE